MNRNVILKCAVSKSVRAATVPPGGSDEDEEFGVDIVHDEDDRAVMWLRWKSTHKRQEMVKSQVKVMTMQSPKR